MENLSRRITKYYERKRSNKNVSINRDEICITVEGYHTPKKAKVNKPLEEISSNRHRYRRLQPVIDMVKEIAAEEQTTEHYLLGIILHQLYYHKDRNIAEIGNNLMMLQDPTKIYVEAAANLKCYNNLGREGYQREIRAFQTSGFDVLPSWKSVRSFENSITPEIQHLPDGLGVEYKYRDAIEITIKRIFNVMDGQKKLIPGEMTLEVKDGIDGSGSHSVFNQNG